LGLETHVKHAISLIEDEVLDVAQRNAASFYEIHKTTGGSHEKIAAALDLTKLRTDVGTTVDNTRAHPRTVGELARLVVNLRDKLTSRCENERCGVCLALASELTSSSSGCGRRTVKEGLRQDGEEETTSLSGTSLSTSHKITAVGNDGNRVLLDWGGNLVVSKLDVAAEVLIEGRSGELENRLGDIVSRSLDGDVIVLLEVDTSLLLRRVIDDSEKLALNARVGRTGNVLAVLPLTVARATSSVGTAAAAAVTAFLAAVATTTTAATPAATASSVWRSTWGSVTREVGLGTAVPVVLTGTVVLAIMVSTVHLMEGAQEHTLPRRSG
jgi:hypothetical protein